MAPKGFKLAGRGRRQIKGSIGGGGGVRVRSKGRSGGGGTGTAPGGTPPGGTPPGGTPPGYVKDPNDPTLFRDRGGAFTTEGYVNVPGGRVFVLPGDTMSEAIGQGKGLIGMAKTEMSRSAGGSYTQGGYVRTGQNGSRSVTRVRAGDTRSEVIGAARAASRSAVSSASRARSQATARMAQSASERVGVGVRASSPARSTAPRGATRPSSAGSAPRAAAPRSTAPRGAAQPSSKASVAAKAPTPVKKRSTTARKVM
jgi:hypothetical protein